MYTETIAHLIANLTTTTAAAEPLKHNYTGLYIAIGITVLAVLFCAFCLILTCCGCGWWSCCDNDDWR